MVTSKRGFWHVVLELLIGEFLSHVSAKIFENSPKTGEDEALIIHLMICRGTTSSM